MTKQLEEVNHEYIRYANCWEDVEVLRQGLSISSGDRVLSVASAGDNSIALLLDDPSEVIAVDINRPQLFLTELKIAAISSLAYHEFLEFLGFRPSSKVDLYFNRIKNTLSTDAANFWNDKLGGNNAEIIHQGKFEKYFKIFRTRVLPLIHSSRTVDTLFSENKQETQLLFFQKTWNTWRWKALFRVFFSRFVMGKFGRDPEFLKQVEVPVGTFIYRKASEHLSSTICRNNYFLQYIMKGQFMTNLPVYAREENYEIIKSRINRITLHEGLVESVGHTHGLFDCFNLSNIFEYMDRGIFRKVISELESISKPGARFGYWNLMVPRSMAENSPKITESKELSEKLSERDLGFFYSSFHIDFFHEY